MSLSISVSGRSRNNLPRNANARLNAGMRDAVDAGQARGAEIAAANTPRKRPYTFSTVAGVVVGGGDHVTGYFGSDYDVFEFLNEGTRPHPIPNAFGRGITVQHPGTRALKILDEAAPIAAEITKQELRQAFAAVFG